VAVKVLGMNGVPEAGLEFSVVENDKDARALAEERTEQARNQEKERRPKVTLENLFETLASESSKILSVVVKADAQGSVEAIVDALKKVDSTKVALEIIHSAVGSITESDVLLASASKAIILGFHTRIDTGVSDIAKREGVQIKLYAIIYELIDEVKEGVHPLQRRQRRRLCRHQRSHRQRQSAGPAPQGTDLRGRHSLAAPFSGRSQRSPGRCGMRHPAGWFQRFPGG